MEPRITEIVCYALLVRLAGSLAYTAGKLLIWTNIGVAVFWEHNTDSSHEWCHLITRWIKHWIDDQHATYKDGFPNWEKHGKTPITEVGGMYCQKFGTQWLTESGYRNKSLLLFYSINESMWFYWLSTLQKLKTKCWLIKMLRNGRIHIDTVTGPRPVVLAFGWLHCPRRSRERI